MTLVIRAGQRTTTLVESVCLEVRRGEIVGIVGESGCGKSLSMLGLLGLLPSGVEYAPGTRIQLDQVEPEQRAKRSTRPSLIPSDAGSSLDPVRRIGSQLDRALRSRSRNMTRSERRKRIIDLLGRVRLPDPEQIMSLYPHQLSGGMQQRVAIASALLDDPQLVVADEPTTALDVTVQAQVLNLLLELRSRTKTAILFVTHDMTAIAELCDRVVVMYAGQVVEVGAVDQIIERPQHPYTAALLSSVPAMQRSTSERLATIPGAPPRPGDWPTGCRFRPRCPVYEAKGRPDICHTLPAAATADNPAACHFAGDSA